MTGLGKTSLTNVNISSLDHLYISFILRAYYFLVFLFRLSRDDDKEEEQDPHSSRLFLKPRFLASTTIEFVFLLLSHLHSIVALLQFAVIYLSIYSLRPILFENSHSSIV
jgi:hypothetical protein